MNIDGSQQVTSFSRVAANELAKGYYPTHPADVARIAAAIKVRYGWSRGTVSTLSVFDPCAREGEFLASVKRALVREHKSIHGAPEAEILALACELDQGRFEKIRGCHQKVCGSFFDMKMEGAVSVALLNPPYHKGGGEILSWLEKVSAVLHYQGLLVLIVPDYEFHRPALESFVDKNFTSIQVFKSENYARFKQLVVFLNKSQNNRRKMPFYAQACASNFQTGNYPTLSEFEARHGRPFHFSVDAPNSPLKPLLLAKEHESLYQDCAAQVDALAAKVLSRTYPQAYDTSLKPLSSLRTAHAVQLAAMNSQVESVRLNGTDYLAKYMVKETCETFHDPECGTETTIVKPTVEAYLMDRQGKVETAKALGFDYYELNAQLSSILLQRLTRTYRPLHEVGADPDYLKAELEPLGLMPPQKEAVKAVVKGFRDGTRGLAIRGNTGTGKTYMAKSIKLSLPEVRRTVFVTEPHLVPQIAREYAQEPFAVHRIESWEDLNRLARQRPEGLYLIAYSRLRMHPKFEGCAPERKVLVKSKGSISCEVRAVCPDCWQPLELKLRKADKEKCPACGSPLYTYVPENDRGRVGFRAWLRQVEAGGPVVHRSSDNRQLPYIRHLKRVKFDLAVFDEAHNAANLISNQGTAFIRLASTARKRLLLSATFSNGMAKSLFNLLWGMCPQVMEADGWSRASATDFQARFGAFKEVRRSDENNRHRGSERVSTYDTAGISPGVLPYLLPHVVNVDSDDFEDLPPVHREVVRCEVHPEVQAAMAGIERIIDNAELSPEDKLAAISVRNAAFLRVADTFCHFNDELTLRGVPLGTLHRRPVEGLLDKERQLIRLVNEALARNERVLIYVTETQKLDMRPVLKRLLRKHTAATVEVLADSTPAKRVVEWFEKSVGDVVLASYKRCGTGLNLSQFPTIIWYSYTHISRLAEQGDGRNRRVNTAMLHRRMFGEVRPCRYYYLVAGDVQALQLSFTLEKRMVAALAEGEVPEIDPADCATGDASFSGLLTRALQKGQFNYTDPSQLLKAMTRAENSKVRRENFLPGPAATGIPGAEPPAALPEEPLLPPAPAPMAQPAWQPPAAAPKMQQLDLFGAWAVAA